MERERERKYSNLQRKERWKNYLISFTSLGGVLWHNT